ncbi:MalY/PatB family protein [Thermobrachium celere]|uniref:cysteine-S-conjugate beta-lyase n=1 Tax=Thermobrachium celere DSM 8682 TaxID=941824 RepID=R7RUW7_9CLOT|nr:MalY/PatB family protein [Thermobrachium celere]CDF59265.1 Putative aminotransferase [Thermobrachium celere DSM 8682]
MKYNFDKKVDRSKNHSAKWSEMDRHFISNDLIPLWVADMDFEVAPEIYEAMKEKLEQRIFGYVYRPDSYYQSACDWTKRRYGYEIDQKTLIHSPGVIPSISLIIRLFTNSSDKILIQPPVYQPFSSVVKKNKRTLVTNPLKEVNGRYIIDFDDFEEKCKDPDLKWFILCNPHNPVGRVWTKEELTRMAEICLKYNVRVISDEIWRDIVYKDYKFTPFASLSKEVEDITITCFSPTKTFNIAGLQASFVQFPRKEELEAFQDELAVLDIRRNNAFSLVAIEAGYRKGEGWLNALIDYLEENYNFLERYIKENIPKLKIIKPEGTYLVWLDFREFKLSDKEISRLLQEKAKVALQEGSIFGEEGRGFQRINIACPRYLLEEAIVRIKNVFSKI